MLTEMKTDQEDLNIELSNILYQRFLLLEIFFKLFYVFIKWYQENCMIVHLDDISLVINV